MKDWGRVFIYENCQWEGRWVVYNLWGYVLVLYPDQFLVMMMMIMAVTGRSRNEVRRSAKQEKRKIPIRVMRKQHQSVGVVSYLYLLQKNQSSYTAETDPSSSFIVGTPLEPSISRGGIKVLGKGEDTQK